MASANKGTIGILTGGGDCPGLNAVIRGVVRRADSLGYRVLGIKDGWQGLLKAVAEPLTLSLVSGILTQGGTILGTSRTNPLRKDEERRALPGNLQRMVVDWLIAAGGVDTLGVVQQLADENLKVIGIPATIDNDVDGTDRTLGFDTAVSIVTEAIDRLHTTAESHQRVMVVEVMGRHTGWIAIESGIAGGADCILIPEKPLSMEEIAAIIKKRHSRGRPFSIVIVAEGFTLKGAEEWVTRDQQVDPFGHVLLGGIGDIVAKGIEKMTGFETRLSVLGHVQRGGSPTAYDRVLATRLGIHAVEMVGEGEFGRMVCLRGQEIASIPVAEAMKRLKYVDEEWIHAAEIFFG
jgi:phosphofructokinase-like protein